ncbi:hypothetical protein [Streptomyces indicus]|uniref:PT repeat-containing protein n=1 Tax=Streptomyces indicus TaxID=417292 RepID=A0A1G8WN16_9ACTN|nr:hypothetical protein [Streptomyces indicus]SDJ79020.1 hypothetical protein SAMN05421806_102538 [Streptomyces indicus]
MGRSTRSLRGVLAAAPLVLALALTGCGSGDDGSGVASVSGAKKDGAEPSASADPQEMGMKYAQCMRENGVPMDDPEPGGGIRLKVDGSIPKATVDKAMEACRKYQPQGGMGKNGEGAKKMREFAQCMRKNGVEDFPDPEEGGGIRIDKGLADDPDFEKAQEACGDLMGGKPQTQEKG